MVFSDLHIIAMVIMVLMSFWLPVCCNWPDLLIDVYYSLIQQFVLNNSPKGHVLVGYVLFVVLRTDTLPKLPKRGIVNYTKEKVL